MTDTITVSGVIGTDPQPRSTASGLSILSFRLASSQRHFDRAAQKWVDGETNWYSVSAFRQLAENATRSLSKGQHVIVSGRLRVRPWSSGEKSGISVDLEADTIGHDLSWGTTAFTRVPLAASTSLTPAASPGFEEEPAVDVGHPDGSDRMGQNVASAAAASDWSAEPSAVHTPF